MFAFDGYQAIYDAAQNSSGASNGGGASNSNSSEYAAWDAVSKEYDPHPFDYEDYKVTTSDGWELTLFRILPDSGVANNASGKNPILFMHGGGSDAEDWIAW